MPDDQSRIEALRKGISTSSEAGNVAIRVADLRWLLDQVENRHPDATNNPSGEVDEPKLD